MTKASHPINFGARTHLQGNSEGSGNDSDLHWERLRRLQGCICFFGWNREGPGCLEIPQAIPQHGTCDKEAAHSHPFANSPGSAVAACPFFKVSTRPATCFVSPGNLTSRPEPLEPKLVEPLWGIREPYHPPEPQTSGWWDVIPKFPTRASKLWLETCGKGPLAPQECRQQRGGETQAGAVRLLVELVGNL